MRGAAGRRYAVRDAVAESDLVAIGHASARPTLVTGGSGVALGLPDNFRSAGLLGPGDAGTGIAARREAVPLFWPEAVRKRRGARSRLCGSLIQPTT